MLLKMGEREMELDGRYLGRLREANDLLSDPDALKARMSEDGYLLIRGLHDPIKVQAARDMMLASLSENNQIDLNFPLAEGVVAGGARGSFLGGSKTLTRNEIFLNLVESQEVMGFFAHFLQGDALTFDFKWLRVVSPGDNTGAHYDIVYMGRGTQNLYTCWTPITDVPYDMGPLAILVGSHRGEAYERIRETYGKMDVDRDKVQGAFSNDPFEMVDKFGGQWQTTEFKMGDALIFGMFTMHGSLNNASRRFRISCDTRYQRADEPVDERWVGENPPAHYGWHEGIPVQMEEARSRWGV